MKSPTKNGLPPLQDSPSDSETLWQQIVALPRPIWILSGGLFVNRFGAFVVPFLTLYLSDRGYTAAEIWWIFSAMAVGGFSAMFLGGRLADHVGRKNTMTIALVGGAIAVLLLWRADTLVTLMLTAFLNGITHGMYHPAAHSLMADVLPEERCVTGFAVVRWAVNLGFACGMAAGGFLADRNFDWLFLGDAATSLTFGLVVFFTLPHGVRTSREQSRWAPALRDMAANRPFLALWAANLLAASLFFQWGASVAKLVVDLGYTKSVYGWLMAANGVMIALFEIPIARSVRRRPQHRVIGLGYLACGIGMAMNGFASSWIWVAVALVVFTVGEMVSMPIASAYLAVLSPEKMRGRYAGAVGFTWNIGQSLAPGLGLVLYEWNPSVLWSTTLVAGVGAALILWKLGGARAEDSA